MPLHMPASRVPHELSVLPGVEGGGEIISIRLQTLRRHQQGDPLVVDGEALAPGKDHHVSPGVGELRHNTVLTGGPMPSRSAIQKAWLPPASPLTRR